MQITNIHEAKTHLSKWVDLAYEEGEEIIICKSGKPMAKLIRYQENKGPRKLGILRGKIEISEDFDELPDFLNKAFFEDKDEGEEK